MAVDVSMRKLKVPPRFMPYLEKHRVYELFHDLGDRLAMERPDDPLQFIRECLERLDQVRDKRLVIMMTPPYLDRIRLAQLLSVKTGCGILSRYLVCMQPGDYYDPDTLAENTAKVIKNSDKEGWILSDFPDTVNEAKIMIKAGVLPTHALLVLPNDDEYQTEGQDKLRAIDTTPSLLLEYDNSIYRLRELFQSSLKIVKIKDRSLEDISNLCSRLIMKMPPHLAPKLFRVCLIGPRGSKRRTLAKLLQKQFNLVHVDMDVLIDAARNIENEIGDKFRLFDKNKFPYSIKMVFDLLKTRLNQKDCLDRGYVLTNFPCSTEDFVLLDSIETPPNRVIFLDIDDSECQSRLEDRVVNMYTGSLYSKRAIKGNVLLKTQTLTHPDDESCKVTEEIKFYKQRVKGMMDYCGRTCFVVDARGSTTALLERVEAVLMGPSPAAKPRTGKLPLKQEQIKIKGRKSSEKGPTDVTPRLFSSFPISRTEVVPLIDSVELLQRYNELKKDSHSKHSLAKNSSGTLSSSKHRHGDKSSGKSAISVSAHLTNEEYEYPEDFTAREGTLRSNFNDSYERLCD